MCRQLGAVARGLDVESTKSSILPELVELTKDAEKSVRIAGIEVVGDILDLFNEGRNIATLVYHTMYTFVYIIQWTLN